MKNTAELALCREIQPPYVAVMSGLHTWPRLALETGTLRKLTAHVG